MRVSFKRQTRTVLQGRRAVSANAYQASSGPPWTEAAVKPGRKHWVKFKGRGGRESRVDQRLLSILTGRRHCLA